MRRLLTPAWLAGHVLAAALVLGMLWLGVWQYGRATGGNPLSWGYTLQWPLFAGFTGYLWLREARRRLRDGVTDATATGDGAPRTAGPAGGGVPAARRPVVTRPAPVEVTDRDDPELAAYNHYLAWLNAHPGARPADYPGRD